MVSDPMVSGPIESDPLAERAYRELYPGKALRKLLVVRYSGRFKPFNASVLERPGLITFSLSAAFREVSDEVKVGVMQHLLNRLRRTRIDTVEIRLYNAFLKKLADYVETDRIDPFLKERFDHLNNEYFDGYLLTPNLVWGSHSLRKLGSYEYATDTITISKVLREVPELLDYVLYHEMLHKKHKFSESAGGFARSHTRAFREEERRFRLSNGGDPEKALTAFLRRKRRFWFRS